MSTISGKIGFDLSKFLKKYGTLIALILICLFFSIASPAFATKSNIMTVLRQIAMLTILGGGMTVVMITGRIDLSTGYGTSFLGIFCAALIVHFNIPMWPAALITLLLGAIIGLFSGFCISVLGIPDFIGTLAVGFLVSGLNQAYTKGHPITSLPTGFSFFGVDVTLGIPNAVFIMVIWLIIVGVILSNTRFGRHVYAIGGNKEAALMSGVKIKLNQTLAYMISGIGMGVTALVLTSRLGSAHPLAGDGYLMDAIACVYLGGTVFKEGEPNLGGTVVGALILGVLTNGMTLLNVSYYFQDIAQGIVILLAVTITSWQRSRKK
jgi:ribose transport system permease protein